METKGFFFFPPFPSFLKCLFFLGKKTLWKKKIGGMELKTKKFFFFFFKGEKIWQLGKNFNNFESPGGPRNLGKFWGKKFFWKGQKKSPPKKNRFFFWEKRVFFSKKKKSKRPKITRENPNFWGKNWAFNFIKALKKKKEGSRVRKSFKNKGGPQLGRFCLQKKKKKLPPKNK